MTRRAAVAPEGGSKPALVLGFVVLLLFLVLAVAVIGFGEVVDMFGGSKGFALGGVLPGSTFGVTAEFARILRQRERAGKVAGP